MNIFLRISKVLTKSLLWILLCLLIVFVFLFSTNIGTQWLLTKILPVVGVKAEQVEGSLLGGFKTQNLHINTPSAEIAISDIDADIVWRQLFSGTAAIDHLHVGDVQIKLLAVETEPSEETLTGIPQLPVDIVAQSLALKSFSLTQADGNLMPLSIKNAQLKNIQWTGDNIGLDIHNLNLNHSLINSQLAGHLKVSDLQEKDMLVDMVLKGKHSSQHKDSPLCVSATAQQMIKAGGEALCQLEADLNVQGRLSAVNIHLKANGEDIEANSEASINVFAPIPLEHLTAKLAVTGGLQLDANVQTTMLDEHYQELRADVMMKQLDLSSLMPQSKLGGVLQLTAQASSLTQWQMADMRLNIAEGSRWNAQALKGVVELSADLKEVFEENQGVALEALRLNNTNIDLQLGTNKIKIKGDLGRSDDLLTMDIRLPAMPQLYPGIGESAQVQGQIKGSLAKHHLMLKGNYDPALGEGWGASAFHIDLSADAQFSQILQALKWQGDVQTLTLTHHGYRLVNQTPLAIEVDTASPLSWSVKEAQLNVLSPKGQETQILHHTSQQKEGAIHSSGEVQNLVLEKSIYDGSWQFSKNPLMNADVRLNRRGDAEIGVQANPLANVRQLLVKLKPGEQENIYQLLLTGEGEATKIHADTVLNLQDPLVLDKAVFDVALSDGTVVKGHADIALEAETQKNSIDVDLKTSQLALHKWTFGILPRTVLNGDIKAAVHLDDKKQLLNADVQADFSDDSVWNNQKLSGKLDVQISQSGILTAKVPLYALNRGNIDLTIGKNRIFTQGAFAQEGDNLTIDIDAPSFSDIYPSLSGGALLKGKMSGNVHKHMLDIEANYASKGRLNASNPELMKAQLQADGMWGENGLNAWSGSIQTLSASYQGYGVIQKSPLTLSVTPIGEGGLPEWQASASTLQITLPSNHSVDIQQQGTTGKNGQWTTKGAIRHFVINRHLMDELDKILNQRNTEQRGGVVVRNRDKVAVADLIFDIDWDLSFDKALKGKANIVRRSGDWLVPVAKPFALGLQNLALSASFDPQGGDASQLTAQLLFNTHSRGNANVTVKSDFKGLNPNLKGGTQLKAVGGIKDISWVSVFTNDLLTLGGSIDFDIDLKSTTSGKWQSSGLVNGNDLRIVEVENGVRLLNGTLKASFHDTKVMVNTLHFPSVIRITPSEWRTRQWIEENPPAQRGSLNIMAEWDIEQSKGFVKAIMDHYPIVQRVDRFAMMSGNIDIDVALPKIDLSGKLVANAGWASIDIKDTVPSVDGDVVVLKPGQTTIEAPSNSSNNLNMHLTVDLGPRFYLVGMGLNSGLVGAIALEQDHGRLSAEGQFRTRGGAIEAYGQRLQIAKGEISFGGNITNPVLDIEAVRRGPEVEAGLRVIGTAKRPKITLVSYPEVSEVEKLSWLIMGRGPDSSGADLALLFSVGSSLIGGEEPFYKRIGIDEIGMRAGTVGDVDNILPERTVADSTAYRGYEEANQLFYATKKFGDNWRVSVEQALSGSGTVLRGSYALMRYLTVDLKVGTVNGLELLYKRVFKD